MAVKHGGFSQVVFQENLNKVYLADTSYGIVVGDKGVILTTTNGGAKWEKQESGTENDLLGFSFSPEGMVAVGRGRDSDAIFD